VRRPRVVLLQVRTHPEAERQEQLCFLERCDLAPDQLAFHNLVARPDLAWDDVAGFDAVLVGGAGSHSVTRDYPFSAPVAKVLLRLIDEGRPVFGSCWGHQLIAQALGGSVITDPERGEVGTFAVELTPAGAGDPLFAGLSARFDAQFGHHDRVDVLPPGVEELAFSAACRNQALRVTGKPVYGSQFHSEMNVGHMRARLRMYRDAYLPAEQAEDELDRILRPTPEADRLLGRFLDLYVRSDGAPGGSGAGSA
jgi:GMP synthase (glutamine-hydrolysing)